MSELTYTIEAIEDVMTNYGRMSGAFTDSDVSKVISALTKPKWQPEQVVAYIESENDVPTRRWTARGNLTSEGLRSARPLIQAEVGPEWILADSMQWAVDALVNINNENTGIMTNAGYAAHELEKHQGDG